MPPSLNVAAAFPPPEIDDEDIAATQSGQMVATNILADERETF